MPPRPEPERLGEPPFVARLRSFDVLDSTMDEARRQALAGAPGGTAILARAQRAGRGRGGTRWQSPSEQGLYLTCILWPHGPWPWPSLSPALALALCPLATELGGRPLQVKWPNDLLGQSGKVAGLLLERGTTPVGRAFVLAGLGLNFATPELPASERAAPPLPPSGLLAEGVPAAALADRQAVAHVVLALWRRGYEAWLAHGFAPRRAAFDAAHAYYDAEVIALGAGPGGEDVAGRVRGVAADGRLELMTAGGPLALQTATLRLAARVAPAGGLR